MRQPFPRASSRACLAPLLPPGLLVPAGEPPVFPLPGLPGAVLVGHPVSTTRLRSLELEPIPERLVHTLVVRSLGSPLRMQWVRREVPPCCLLLVGFGWSYVVGAQPPRQVRPLQWVQGVDLLTGVLDDSRSLDGLGLGCDLCFEVALLVLDGCAP